MYGTLVAHLHPAGDYGLNLEWAEDGIARWGRGSRILSVSLPLGVRRPPGDSRAVDFFDNLLPEGPARTAIARIAGVGPADVYGIIEAFGGDCAGAVVVLPEGEVPLPASGNTYRSLGRKDLSGAIRRLESAPLGSYIAAGYRPSLAGYQRKLLVARDGRGRWQRPEGGSPSTWILKPDGRVPMAENEFTCLNLAGACGLEVPDHELLIIEGIPALAIKRYDREIGQHGISRLHQEDGCQAVSVPPDFKRESDGGPSLLAIASVVRDFGRSEELSDLLARVTFSTAIGNADAHAKNTSFLHAQDGSIRLAPVYDLLSTISLEPVDERGRPVRNDPRMGQMVNGILDISRVRGDDLVEEGASWRLPRKQARRIVGETLERARDALGATEGEERVLGYIATGVARLSA